jgi:hypothetical protein
MQAGLYLTATRGLGSPEAGICYERAEPLCHSLGRPRLLCLALRGQLRFSIQTDKMSATMQIAQRVYSLAQGQDDPTLMIGACNILSCTLFYLGDFEAARQYARRGVQIWRSEASSLMRKTSKRQSSAVCAIGPSASGISERSPLAKR